jgi:hypothetical protein
MRTRQLVAIGAIAAILLSGCTAAPAREPSSSSRAVASNGSPVSAATSSPSPVASSDASASGPDCAGFVRWLNQTDIGPYEEVPFPAAFASAWRSTLPACTAQVVGGSNQEYLVLSSVQEVHDALIASGGTMSLGTGVRAEISIANSKFAPVPSLVAAAAQSTNPGFEVTRLTASDDYSLWVDGCGDDPGCQQ